MDRIDQQPPLWTPPFHPMVQQSNNSFPDAITRRPVPDESQFEDASEEEEAVAHFKPNSLSISEDSQFEDAPEEVSNLHRNKTAAKSSTLKGTQFEDAPEDVATTPKTSTSNTETTKALFQLATAESNTSKTPEIGQNDVLCGRGGFTNSHPGNVYFRQLVREMQADYVRAIRYEKAQIAHHIVEKIRNQSPPGRFLKKDKHCPGIWVDIGNQKAREKTSQALREGAPELRIQVLSGGEVNDGLAEKRSVTPPPPATVSGNKRKMDEISDSNLLPGGSCNELALKQPFEVPKSRIVNYVLTTMILGHH